MKRVSDAQVSQKHIRKNNESWELIRDKGMADYRWIIYDPEGLREDKGVQQSAYKSLTHTQKASKFSEKVDHTIFLFNPLELWNFRATFGLTWTMEIPSHQLSWFIIKRGVYFSALSFSSFPSPNGIEMMMMNTFQNVTFYLQMLLKTNR